MIEQLRHGLAIDVTPAGIAGALAGHDGDVGGDDLARLSDVLADFVCRVPDAIGEVLAMSKDVRCGRAIAFATGSILKYVFDPDDLIPESGHGELGLLDDAFLVHTFVARLAATYPFASSASYQPPGPGAMRAAAALLPDGIAPSLERTADIIIQVAQALLVAGADGSGGAGGVVDPQLRVGAAAAALSGSEIAYTGGRAHPAAGTSSGGSPKDMPS